MTTTQDLLDRLRDNLDEREKLALGEYYEHLNLSSEQEQGLKEDIFEAKRYEQQMIDHTKRKLEGEELRKLLADTEDDDQIEYFKSVREIQQQAEQKLEAANELVRHREKERLSLDREELRKKQELKLDSGRYQFGEKEKKYEDFEVSEFSEKESWRKKLTQKAGKVVLLMTVDIGDGRVDNIEVRKGDDYAELALNFKLKHDLPDDVITPLTHHIKSNVMALKKNKSKKKKPMSQSKYLEQMSQRSQYVPVKEPSIPEDSVRGMPVIDKKSRKLAKRAKDSNKPVHIRLFNQALELRKKREDNTISEKENQERDAMIKKHRMTHQSRHLSQTRTADQFENYGIKLYEEGRRMLDQRLREHEHQKKINKVKEVVDVTFKPQISEYAQTLNRSQENLVSRMYDHYNKTQAQRDRLKDYYEEKDLRKCSFQPAINPKSAKIMQEKEERRRAIGASHYELLFRDAERRRVERQENSERSRSSFKPQVSKFDDNGVQRAESRTEFLNRLTYEKQVKANANDDKPVDPITGQPLFVPQLRKDRVYEYKGPTGNIYEDLYRSRMIEDEKRDNLVEGKQRLLEEKSRKKHVTETSEKILDKRLKKRLQSLFNSFDTKKTGYVNIREADLSQLDPDLQNKLKDIFSSVDRIHLSFDEFEKLYRQHTKKVSGPKYSLLASINRKRHPSTQEKITQECTFRPSVSKNSLKYAQKKGNRPPEVLYQTLHDEAKLWKRRAAEMQQEKERKNYSQCTFHPNIRKQGQKIAIDPDKIEDLSQRLSTHRKPTRNEILTTADLMYREHCTFKPNLKKPNPAPLDPFQRDLSQSYVDIHTSSILG